MKSSRSCLVAQPNCDADFGFRIPHALPSPATMPPPGGSWARNATGSSLCLPFASPVQTSVRPSWSMANACCLLGSNLTVLPPVDVRHLDVTTWWWVKVPPVDSGRIFVTRLRGGGHLHHDGTSTRTSGADQGPPG